MTSKYLCTTIGEVCSVGDGAHTKVTRQNFGVPYLTSKNIGSGFLKLDNVDFISEEDFEKLFPKNSKATRRLKLGDVLIGIIGTFGNAYRYKEIDHFGVSSSVAILRPNQSVLNPNFLFYVVISNSFKQAHLAYKSGSVQGYTNIPTIKCLPIPLPPLEEQKAIAHILGTLDDKIELNQQMNRNLEAITQTMFKSWFVDFDPVRAKMEGRQPAGMDAATATLFPDSFKDSPIGEIPKGWTIKPLDRVANFLNGLALQKYLPINDEYLPVIKIAELRRGITESSGRASLNINKEYVIEDGDVLFSWSGSLEVCIWCGGKGALNQHLFKVTSTEFPKWFYYQWVKYYLPNFQAIAASKATTMGHIQRHHLSEAQTVVPPEDTLQRMDKTMVPLLERIVNNNLESRTLTATRNTLLPKLMSGEIRVKEAEKILEGVA